MSWKYIKDTIDIIVIIDIIKNYKEDSEKGYFLEVDVQHPDNLHNLHNDLPFLPERIQIEKIEKSVVNLLNEKEHFVHIRNLKQAHNQGLVLKRVDRVIKFN